MYGRRYQRKRGFKRVVVTLLSLVMLLSVCFPGLRASAEDIELTDAAKAYEDQLKQLQQGQDPENPNAYIAALDELAKAVDKAYEGDEITAEDFETLCKLINAAYPVVTEEAEETTEVNAEPEQAGDSDGLIKTASASASAVAVYGPGGSRPTEPTTPSDPAEIFGDPIKVYVYVSSTDSSGTSWRDNVEFQDLIGLYACDANGYFPAGVIELDASYLEGKEANYNTPGAPLINSVNDWTILLAALGQMDTSTLNGTYGVAWSSSGISNFSENRGNSVNQYLSQASQDIDKLWGSMSSALFRWHLEPVLNTPNASYGFDDQSVKFHLDLCFNINKITFITGNNGINSGYAKDGTVVDTRAYITGSEIQEPRNLTIPAGYKFMGYYEDANFTIPWDGIGTPLNEDQIVYIKITPEENVILYYVNVTGDEAGSLSLDNEGLNPVTGTAQGSTATANDGYVFEGWYADEDCTQLLSTDATYTPTKEAGERWIDGTTYYAKFIPNTASLTITKVFDGLDNVTPKPSVTFYVKDEDGNVVENVTLDGSEDTPYSITYSNLTIGKYTVEETDPSETFGNFDYQTTSYKLESAEDSVEGLSAEVTLGVDGETVCFTNTYERATASLSIIKTFTNTDTDFNLPDKVIVNVNGTDYELTNSTDNPYVFTETIENVYVGDTYTIEEEIPEINYWDHVSEESVTTAEVTVSRTDNVANLRNTYARSVGELTVTKTLTGNMRDTSKTFSFTVSVAGKPMDDTVADGAGYTIVSGNDSTQITFALGDGQQVSIPNIPLGASVTITEIPDGYTASSESGNIKGDATFTISSFEGDTTVSYINDKTLEIIDTGITTDSAPFIALFIVATVGLGLLLLNKRRYTGKF